MWREPQCVWHNVNWALLGINEKDNWYFLKPLLAEDNSMLGGKGCLPSCLPCQQGMCQDHLKLYQEVQFFFKERRMNINLIVREKLWLSVKLLLLENYWVRHSGTPFRHNGYISIKLSFFYGVIHQNLNFYIFESLLK